MSERIYIGDIEIFRDLGDGPEYLLDNISVGDVDIEQCYLGDKLIFEKNRYYIELLTADVDKAEGELQIKYNGEIIKFQSKKNSVIRIPVPGPALNLENCFETTNLSYNNCVWLRKILKFPDTSACTNFKGFLRGCVNLDDFEFLRDIDVSAANSLELMLSGCINMTTLEPMSGWNVSKCDTFSNFLPSSVKDISVIYNWSFYGKNIGRLFYSNSQLNEEDIAPLLEKSVYPLSIDEIFEKTTGIKNLDLSKWNVSMRANRIISFSAVESLNLSGSIRDIGFFSNAYNLTTVTGNFTYNPDNITIQMNCPKLSMESLRHIFNSMTTQSRSPYTIRLSNKIEGSVPEEIIAIATEKGYSITYMNDPIG